MSVIIAYKKDNRIYMACDSQSTAGDIKNYGACVEQYKIKVYKDYLFGSCGGAKAGRLVTQSLGVLDNLKRFDKDSLVREFIPAMYKVIKESGNAEVKDDGISFDNEFLLAYKDKCYIIDQTNVYPIQTYGIIGSGIPYVKPLVENYDSKEDIKTMMKNAIEFCESKHTYVSGPVRMADTVNLKVEEV